MFVVSHILKILLDLNLKSAFTWWILENEGAEFVSGVQHASVTTSLAGVSNGLLLVINVLQWEHLTVLSYIDKQAVWQ